MKEEISRVQTGQVTYAVRDTHIDDKEIHEGDIMGIGDHGILAVGKELNEITKETINLLTDEETELISIYYGEDVKEEDAEEVWERNYGRISGLRCGDLFRRPAHLLLRSFHRITQEVPQ